jgi:hypothetical protein
MHGDPTELFPDHLTFSSVNARANMDAEFPDRVHNSSSATDRTCRTIERRQEAVAGSVDLSPSVPRELITNKGVMLRKKLFPSSVAEFDQSVRRLDDIREQYGGEYAVTIAFDVAALAGQERFNLAQN